MDDLNMQVAEEMEEMKRLLREKRLSDFDANKWPDEFGGPVLFVRKLRSSDPPMTDNQIAVVLEALETTCHSCWNADTGCQCWNDE